ncbi:peptidylprolyl isomerase [Mariprofundus sp. EBB-1]|uniref:peptidylprolyl isomerase n=1 Tax=Mariprofundus sp. EBB-1 TaxID=2650971 RepID=UPI000EF1D601|nr:peptidylprolyl isomerase [Mariprofundus sp. EBB-1]RLL55056.1 peptidylprolyl isomerase [Mariprofundus sp. EBB-1]
MHFPFLLVSLLLLALPVRAETIDAIAAVANNNVITCFEIEQDTQEMLVRLRQSGAANLPTAAQLNRRSLDARVVKLLQLVEAKKLELSVSPEELSNAIQDVESKNGMMPGQLKEVLAQQGSNFEDFQENMHDQILVSKLINVAVRSKLQISEEAISEYYRKYLAVPKARREVQMAQIFLALPAEPTPQLLADVRNKARNIHQQLIEGKDFTQLVAIYSESPDRQQQGVMGWFMEGGISQRFAPALDLPVGGITNPIRSPSGFHIIKATSERWKEPETLGESHDEVHARHILLQIPSSADEATRKKIFQRAEAISEDMQGATDEAFVTRAKEASQGPSASNGGDLGWFTKGAMLPVFEKAAFAMQAGETSAVVESKFGLHIIRVVAKRHIDPNSLEVSHDKIQQILSNVALQDQLPRWIASLRADADISYRTCPGVSVELPVIEVGEEDAAQMIARLDTELKSALDVWRKAWAKKDFATYFAAYSPLFKPGKAFADIDAWKASRRDLIGNKQHIQVDIQDLKITHLEGNHARLEFTQRYQADGFSRSDFKLILMEYTDSRWRIIREMTAVQK